MLLLLVIYVSFISLGLQDSLLGAAWSSMYSFFNVPLHYAGFISVIYSSGTVIAAAFSALVLRRFGTGVVMAVCVLMTSCALIGFSFSNSFLYLCLLAVPLGLGGGSIDAALNNYVALNYKARYMSWLHCFWGAGASVGPIVMSLFLLHKNSWSLGYRTIGIFQIGLMLILIIFIPKWKSNNSPANVSPTNAEKQNDPINIKKIFSIAGVKEVLLIFFCYCAIESITGLWGASYLAAERGISPGIAARWISFYFVGITAGRFLSGFITIKLNNRQMVRLGQIIIGCGIIILVLPFADAALLPALFLIGLGCAPIFPSLIHETPKNFGKEYSQAIVGIQMGSAYVGSAIMPPIFGWLSSFMSFSIFPVIIGIILVIKIVLFEVLKRKLDKTSE